MTDRFPDYDVLTKRDTPSWNPQTRRVVDQRIAMGEPEGVLSDSQRATLKAVIDRITPQPENRPPVNAAAVLMDKIASDAGDGFRPPDLPRVREAWTRGLDAIDDEARQRTDTPFAHLDGYRADQILTAIERGQVESPLWQALPPKTFWKHRLIPDVVSSYYAHPSAWSACGFGGPAAPRGYVRLSPNQRDPWEAAEVDDGRLLSSSFRNRHVG